MPDRPDRTSPERNPLGLGPRDPEGSNTGSIDDTMYEARDSDPYTTGEPWKLFDSDPTRAPRDEDVPGTDEP